MTTSTKSTTAMTTTMTATTAMTTTMVALRHIGGAAAYRCGAFRISLRISHFTDIESRCPR